MTPVVLALKAKEILKGKEYPSEGMIRDALEASMVSCGIDPESGAGIFLYGLSLQVWSE
jgi:hypothetical protein